MVAVVGRRERVRPLPEDPRRGRLRLERVQRGLVHGFAYDEGQLVL